MILLKDSRHGFFCKDSLVPGTRGSEKVLCFPSESSRHGVFCKDSLVQGPHGSEKVGGLK